MIPEHIRIDIAAKEVAKVLGLNWETVTRGNRAKCYQIARVCFSVCKDEYIPSEGIIINDPGA
jgi:hypothetical protein